MFCIVDCDTKLFVMRKLLFICLLASTQISYAQDAVGYQLPPKEMADILLAKPTPGISIDKKGEWMLLIERSSYPTVEELAQPELKIAGLRLNPNNFGPSRQSYALGYRLKNLKTNEEFAISGLPNNVLASNAQWNPNNQKIAFTNSTGSAIDLYVIDVATKTAKKINQQPLNAVLGSAYTWLNADVIIYKAATRPASAAPPKSLKPKGPAVQQSLGKAAPSFTYQDLIKTPYDEELFAFMATSQLIRNANGIETNIGAAAMYSNVSPSPDKKYLLISTIQKPFSYLVTVYDFPTNYDIKDVDGKQIANIVKNPSSEGVPIGYDNVETFPRNIGWRGDEAATILYAQALDSGVFKNNMPFHDALYVLPAPFSNAKEWVKLKNRFYGIEYTNSNYALAYDGDQAKKQMSFLKINFSNNAVEELSKRSMDDSYGDPGNPVTMENSFGEEVVATWDNGNQFMMNNTDGASAKGSLPFLAIYDVRKKQNNIIWRCEEPNFEFVSAVIDPMKQIVVTRKEGQADVPNYYLRDLKLKSSKAITVFADPTPILRKVKKEKINYKRSDGIDLTATVYLPEGFKPGVDKPLPVFMWAYPREFKSAADAGQVRGSKYTFTRVNWGSPIYWVTQGYCVMDETEMPIVGEGDKEPNDNFIPQLYMNAKAAIDKIAELGYGDSLRVGVGGHSYGSFMTANLLAHTNLFKAGIARSGAHNRTLTPFGFQNERRTYWQAPEVYYNMSPFSFAHKIKTPILLIHGDADNNPGTFPIQSERLYNAIKGNGGTVRYVSLPYESHGYQGKENLLHMLWETTEWLNKYVKGK